MSDCDEFKNQICHVSNLSSTSWKISDFYLSDKKMISRIISLEKKADMNGDKDH